MNIKTCLFAIGTVAAISFTGTALADGGLTFSNTHATNKKFTDADCQAAADTIVESKLHSRVVKNKGGLLKVKGSDTFTATMAGKTVKGIVHYSGAQTAADGPVVGTWKTRYCAGDFSDSDITGPGDAKAATK